MSLLPGEKPLTWKETEAALYARIAAARREGYDAAKQQAAELLNSKSAEVFGYCQGGAPVPVTWGDAGIERLAAAILAMQPKETT